MTATQDAPTGLRSSAGSRFGKAKAQRSSPESVPVRRRWGRIAAGAVLALLGGWVSVSLYLTAGDRVDVVVAAREVPQFTELTEDDLTTARVAADQSVETISGSSLDDLIGQVNEVPLAEGTVLAEDQLHPSDEPIVTSSESVVAFSLPSDRLPSRALDPGTSVRLMLQARGNDGGTSREVPAWVLRVGDEQDDQAASRSLEVVVSSSAAPEVTDAASNGRVDVVVDGEL